MNGDHEWLKLIDTSGPFLAVPVLRECFPTGLEDVQSRIRRRLRSTYEEWQEVTASDSPDIELVHEAWVETVLTDVLEYGEADLKSGDELPEGLVVPLPEHGISIEPTMALVDVTRDNECLFMIDVLDAGSELDETIQVDGRVTTPAERMVLILRGTGCPIGLLTNGEKWMLVHAPEGEMVSQMTWHARFWLQESETLRAFVSLLRLGRFFGAPDGKLPALFEKSKDHQDDVTEALGDQVGRAIEVLIRSLDRADEERDRELLSDVPPAELYEAGLTVMMRLVFLLAAEERDLILLGDPKYDAFYAVSSLRRQLRGKADARLGHEHDAWSRLLAVFRMVYGGVEHPALRLPALGGSLFDPDRFPFLEGRAKGTTWRNEPAMPLPIDDWTVLLLLDAIQLFQGRTLSYKGLDVEQIGHVYEGLLEKTVRRIDATTLQLKPAANANDPFVTLDEAEEARRSGGTALKDLIVDKSGRSASAVQNVMERTADDDLIGRLLTACRGDDELSKQIMPYVNLLEVDAWGYPLVHPMDAFVVGLGQDRRESGSHYTPKSLTEKIVEETLTPIVYLGPAEGLPRDEWRLKNSDALMDLKVCDPAMGSGAFLVQVCRWLSDRLVETWALGEEAGDTYDAEGSRVDADGSEIVEPLPRSPDDRSVIAKRVIAEKCLYGVDLNPLAVELAKLSLWLTTLSKGHPFGFLDHNLRSGNSLLGIDDVRQVIDLTMTPDNVTQERLFGRSISDAVKDATEIRLSLREVPIRDIKDVATMASMDLESRELIQLPILLADALVGIELAETTVRTRNARTEVLAGLAHEAAHGNDAVRSKIRNEAIGNLATDSPSGRPQIPFHWPLEFPEVFGRENGGFDAVVGNPPFLGGKRISGANGKAFREFIVRNIAGGRKGSADLVSYFFLSSFVHIRNGGGFGLLAVNSISEGDTRQVGLEHMLKDGAAIHAAYPNEAWPGTAAVVTSRVHVHKGEWEGAKSLSGSPASFISAFLSDREEWTPQRLKANENIVFVGSVVHGKGFVLEPNEAQRMLDDSSINTDVIFPYLNGQNLNGDPEQKPRRWVINYWDWPKERAAAYRLPFERIATIAKKEREAITGNDASARRYRRLWWLHGRDGKALYHAIGRGGHFDNHPEGWSSGTDRPGHVLVRALNSKHHTFAFVDNDMVFDQTLNVFKGLGFAEYATLSSEVHCFWFYKYCARLGAAAYPRYIQSDVFSPYPYPNLSEDNAAQLKEQGSTLWNLRSEYMKQNDIGLTGLFNLENSPEAVDRQVSVIRDQAAKIDHIVLESYGWNDLTLNHQFREVSYLPPSDRIRFSISREAEIEILQRLEDLNKERYEAEVARGLHG
jgi:hypothetical protein